MNKTAKSLIEEEIRKQKSKLRRIDFDRDRLVKKIEELEASLEALKKI